MKCKQDVLLLRLKRVLHYYSTWPDFQDVAV